MTCIVAIPNGKTVVFAADSATYDAALGVVFETDDKVQTVPLGNELVGLASAGDGSLLPLITSKLELPPTPVTGEEDRWAQTLAECFTDMAREHKVLDDDDKVDGFVLTAFRGRLWTLYDYQAMRIDEPTAIGCGAPFALGALAVMGANTSRAARARRAALVACRYNPFCRPPIVVTEV